VPVTLEVVSVVCLTVDLSVQPDANKISAGNMVQTAAGFMSVPP